ncbi:hypothetical protein ACWDWU_01085 [Streptomyces sp. NPDC003442]
MQGLPGAQKRAHPAYGVGSRGFTARTRNKDKAGGDLVITEIGADF